MISISAFYENSLNEIIHVKCLAGCLGHAKYLLNDDGDFPAFSERQLSVKQAFN